MIQLSSAGQLFAKQGIYTRLPVKNGNNQSKTVLIIYDYEAEQLPQPAKEMLEKLITACKFDMAKVAYINSKTQIPNSIGTLKNSYGAEVILVFGPVNLSRNIPALKLNHPYHINGLRILQTLPVEQLVTNDKEKKALWGGLQRLISEYAN